MRAAAVGGVCGGDFRDVLAGGRRGLWRELVRMGRGSSIWGKSRVMLSSSSAAAAALGMGMCSGGSSIVGWRVKARSLRSGRVWGSLAERERGDGRPGREFQMTEVVGGEVRSSSVMRSVGRGEDTLLP